jgi:hypothetical protein
MFKIKKVTLKESEVVEVDGEYKLLLRGEKTIPCYLTNFSLKRGKELSLLSGSLMSDAVALNELTKVGSIDDVNQDSFNNFDEVRMMAVVYLGCLGANPKLDISFDEFVSQFHDDYETLLTLYADLIAGFVERDPNQFAKGLQKSTKASKKKSNHQ